MRTSTSARDTLVLFNTSHKHNKITRPAHRVRHVTRASPRWPRSFRAKPRRKCCSPLSSFVSRSLLSPCRRGLSSRRARDYYLLHDALVDGSPALARGRHRPHTTSSPLRAGETRSYFPRPASHCTMILRPTPKYAKRQQRLSTDGRSAYMRNVCSSNHSALVLSGRTRKVLSLSSLTALRMPTETYTWVSPRCHDDSFRTPRLLDACRAKPCQAFCPALNTSGNIPVQARVYVGLAMSSVFKSSDSGMLAGQRAGAGTDCPRFSL